MRRAVGRLAAELWEVCGGAPSRDIVFVVLFQLGRVVKLGIC